MQHKDEQIKLRVSDSSFFKKYYQKKSKVLGDRRSIIIEERVGIDNLQGAIRAIENKDFSAYKSWLRNFSPDQTNKEGNTLVSILLNNYIYKWVDPDYDGYENHVNRCQYLQMLGDMLSMLKNTRGYKKLTEEELFIVRQIFNRKYLNEDFETYLQNRKTFFSRFGENKAICARDVYDPTSKNFTISCLQRKSRTQYKTKLYTREDFVVCLDEECDNWDRIDGRYKIGVKLGTLFITYRPEGKGSFECTVERLNFRHKRRELLHEFTKGRYSVDLPFNALVPFHDFNFYLSKTNICWQVENVAESLPQLRKALGIRNQIIAMALSNEYGDVYNHDLNSEFCVPYTQYKQYKI